MDHFHQRRRTGSRIDKNIAGLYDIEKTLGSGHFAVVKLARHVFTGEKVAVKVIDKTKLDEVSRAHLYQEVRCMKLVQHPNVVRLYEVVDTPTKLYLILEFGDGGDMYDHIMKYEGKGIIEEKAKHYFRQVVSAIDYCHKLHVVHRDLKPENVIFFKSLDVAKLTDFGFSNSFSPGEKLSTSCGSLAYSAPEILLGDSYEPPAVDVWSLGVILYMMVCGEGPFNHTNDSETLTKIMDCSYLFPDHLSEGCKSLISRMLVREPSKRASLESIYNDPWLKSGIEEVDESLPPLISEIRVTPDLHLSVLQKMETGNIAKREEIKRSLEDNKYDHITATYFLIAEKLLKKSYGSTAFHLKLEDRRSFPYEETRCHSDPNLLDVEGGEENVGSSSPELRHRTQGSNSPNWSGQRRSSIPRSLDDMADLASSDPVVNEDSVTYTTEMAPRSFNIAPRTHRLTYPTGLIKATTSSPNLLNEISEENESDFDDSPRNSPKTFRRQQRRQRKYENKRHGCRLSPIPSRRSSYSSSDDEEFQKLDRRLNIQAALSAARTLPNVPENSGDKETTGERNGCLELGKAKAFDLLERFFESEKEHSGNHLSAFDGPNKLFVTSVNGRVRNLSDTNLVSYQAQYRLPIIADMKCSSDTNLAISGYGKKALNQRQDMLKLNLKQNPFALCTSPTLSSAGPIEEENPSDISPDGSPVTEPKHVLSNDISNDDESMSYGFTRLQGEFSRSASNSHFLPSHLRLENPSIIETESLPDSHLSSQPSTTSVIQAHTSYPLICCDSSQRLSPLISVEQISSIGETGDDATAVSNGVRDNAQSRSGSRSSLKYIYNDAASSDGNPCYTIAEAKKSENEPIEIRQTSEESIEKSSIAQKIITPKYSVGKFGRLVTSAPVNSRCCTII